MIITKKRNGHACIISCGVQLFGDTSKIVHNPSSTNYSFKIFNKALIRWIAIALNTNSVFTGLFTEKPFRYYQQLDLRQIGILRGGQPVSDYDTSCNYRLCYYNESDEFSRSNSIHPHGYFQRPLRAIFRFNVDARCNWRLSLPLTRWRAFETRAEFFFRTWAIYRGYCIGRTDVFSSSRQVWCRWKKHSILIILAFDKYLTAFHSSSIVTLVLIRAI